MNRRVIVEADGGSRGNPGPAGYGAVVRDAGSNEVLAELHGGLGIATNNVAEYSGLIAGLRSAKEIGASIVDAKMDSKLVVEQMSGRWQVKNAALQQLAMEARALVSDFDRVTFEWIPRARNSHADRLANEAMDAQAAAENPENSPANTPKHDAVSPPRWHRAEGQPTTLVLLRHGQTPLSIERRYSGIGDVPLTEHGHQQAADAAKRLSKMTDLSTDGTFAPIITSPLLRARQTAQALAEAVSGTVETLEDLRETDFGAWEGLTLAEAEQRDPEVFRQWRTTTSTEPPGGESFDAVHRRVRRARDTLIERFTGQTVVVVSHVTPIKSLLRLGLDGDPSLLFRLHLDLASLSIVDFYRDGNALVRLVNDTGHLSSSPISPV